jgi:hypothetical protein
MILPEDRTEIEIERTVICNRLVHELWLHEMRLAEAMAHEDGREQSTPKDYYAAVCSTYKARQMIDELYGDP